MKYAVALLLVTISMVSGSTLVAPVAVQATIKGPSSATTVTGPDGSSVSASAKGGAVVVPGEVVVAAVPEVVAAPVAPAAIIAGPSGVIATQPNPWGWGPVVAVAPPAAVVAPGVVWGPTWW